MVGVSNKDATSHRTLGQSTMDPYRAVEDPALRLQESRFERVSVRLQGNW